jgi:hypothetical protein
VGVVGGTEAKTEKEFFLLPMTGFELEATDFSG